MIATDSPFRSAHSALTWAHGIAGLGVYDRPVTSRKEKREPGVRVEPKFAGLTPMENHAQAAWITKVAEQCDALTPLEREMLAAYFLVPNSTRIEMAKRRSLQAVALVVNGQCTGRYGEELVANMVRRFCREQHESDAVCAARMGKSKDAVREYRRRVTKRLHDLLDSALDKLDVAFEERGYVAA